MNSTLILGVTASGKGSLGFELAKAVGGEIVSIDSMKVYRRMDVGTAKPPIGRRDEVRHHLIDVVEPSEAFGVDRFLEMTAEARQEITAGGKEVIGIGGTAMYIKALLYGIFDGPGSDEGIRARLKAEIAEVGAGELHRRLCEVDGEAGERIHPNDERRIVRALEVYELTGKPISSFQQQFSAEEPSSDWTVIGLRREKEVASRRINARVRKMIDDGLLAEVEGLLAEEKPLSKQAACAIGYAEMIAHLKGEMSLDEAVERIKINTRRLAKGQRTWFKTFKNVNWLDLEEDETVESALGRTMEIIGR